MHPVLSPAAIMSRSPDTLHPDFLVIGGMKCASTTLHDDLSRHPSIECGEKELDALTDPGNETVETIYRRNFAGATKDQILGDVSTSYSMLPDLLGIAEKAKAISDNMKIIYLIREPVSRAVSHHQHMTNWSGKGQMGPDINEAILVHSELIDYSCYSMQLTPWRNAFGMENILVLRFEDYIANRQETIAKVFAFLGQTSIQLDLDEAGANRSSNRLYAGKNMFKLYQSTVFKKCIRPLTPVFLKQGLRKLLLTKSKLVETPPTLETVDRIISGVSADIEALEETLGLSEPLWDFADVRRRRAPKPSQGFADHE